MRYFTLLLCLFALNLAQGQCIAPNGYISLENGDLVMTSAVGNLPIGAVLNQPGLSMEVNGQLRSLIYSSGLWIGGTSPDQQLKLAASTYDLGMQSDFFAGPLTTDGEANTEASACAEFDLKFKLYQSLSHRHRVYHDCLNDPDCNVDELFPLGYEIPAYFLEFPGNGDTGFGYELQLSPYYDYNNDGLYSPEQGDYPYFDFFNEGMDCCQPLIGDIAVYEISNDKGNLHTLSTGDQIGVETHQMISLFASEDLNDAVFNRTKIINRGTQTLSDTYVSIFVDGDLGQSTDDLMGSSSEHDMIFFYNGSGNDGDFGNNPPVVAYKLLAGVPMDDDGLDNDDDGIVDNEVLGASSAIGDDLFEFPLTTATSYYNWMQGLYVNGELPPESFQYDGIPDGSEDYLPTDKRQIISSGPFTLTPGVEFCVSGAYFVNEGEETENPALDGFVGLTDKADEIQAFHEDCYGTCLTPTVDITAEVINGGFAFWNIMMADEYLWDFGDGITSDFAYPQHVFEGGEYTVTLTLTNECGTATGSVTIDSTVSTNDLDEVSLIELFPQPANDVLNLRLEQRVQGALIRVSDLTGKTVMESMAQGGLNNINTSQLANGMYVLEILSNEVRVEPKQFIVRH